jgi:hypothetical protein
MHMKFHKDWFRHSEANGGGFTDTETEWNPTNLHSYCQNKESRLTMQLLFLTAVKVKVKVFLCLTN